METAPFKITIHMVSVMPIVLGAGTPFFDHTGHELALHLKAVTTYKSGMVELWYEIKKG